jgi:cell division septation protein DedD
MRDMDRWKDKVELSLDGRQIFFLFFGSAVAACLVFVLGVLVGKRLEARALALAPAPVADPLAALDQLGEAEDGDGLTFHKALTGKKPEKAEKLDEPKAEPPKAEPKAEAPKVEPKAEAPKVELPKLEAPVKVDPPKPEPAKEVAAAKAPLPAGKPQVVAQPAQNAKKPDAAAAHFTLQLSAFPEKSDAEEFMKKIQAAGYKPFLVASEVPGKGIFYRVRVGDYTTRESAMNAKTEFERKQRIIAYVAKL